MIKKTGLLLLGWILVLLQLLNPFLHAHAQGLDGTSGFHVHGEQVVFTATSGPADNPLLMAPDAGHWVLGMPTGQRAVEYSGEIPDSSEVALPIFLVVPLAASRHSGFRLQLASPPGWRFHFSSPPPALAPPAI